MKPNRLGFKIKTKYKIYNSGRKWSEFQRYVAENNTEGEWRKFESLEIQEQTDSNERNAKNL